MNVCSVQCSVECMLCGLWIHSDDENKFFKHWEETDVDALRSNFYCGSCLKTLVAHPRSTREECNVESVLNCLRSFNLEEIRVRRQKEI